MAVGVFDSGLGGLTVLDAVTKRLPDVPFVYFGDNAHAPYGVRDADDVYNLTTAAVERLWDVSQQVLRCFDFGLRIHLEPITMISCLLKPCENGF